MENVEMKLEGDELVIRIDLKQTGAPSSTGKTQLVATTRGAVPIEYKKRTGIKVAVNVTAPLR